MPFHKNKNWIDKYPLTTTVKINVFCFKVKRYVNRALSFYS